MTNVRWSTSRPSLRDGRDQFFFLSIPVKKETKLLDRQCDDIEILHVRMLYGDILNYYYYYY